MSAQFRPTIPAPPLTVPTLHKADARRLGPFALRLLNDADLQALLALRREVLAQLPHPDLYMPEADETGFVASHLGGAGGETIGVFDGDTLAAYAMLGLPRANDPDNLGLRITGTPLGQVAHIASCMVREPYRGRGLQRTLLAARFSLAQAHGRSHALAMVSLHNYASRRNMLREGMRIGWVGDMGGLRRQVLAIDLGTTWHFDTGHLVLADPLDWDRQRALTAGGWWGIGEITGRGSNGLVFSARQALATPAHG